ncbi:sensor histidine kinase [Amnibacterium flavum]|uniref:histidine kinase n=2 Tax=Amnibacterium flavum TaxID=2173173 RepID=A0A2V1HN62_9MICO|nr:HAMP domain-containing sensor histidine kinase [Amnibacterium flavum]PVZ94036.1 sensor histidine kinase [Amnibacterium flavum]
MAERRPVRGRRVSLRTRITLISAAAVAVTLVVGAVLFGALLRFSLIEQLDSAISAQAATVANQLDASGSSTTSGSDSEGSGSDGSGSDGADPSGSGSGSNSGSVDDDDSGDDDSGGSSDDSGDGDSGGSSDDSGDSSDDSGGSGSGSDDSGSDDDLPRVEGDVVLGDLDGTFVQVQNEAGEVVASTDDIAGLAALGRPDGAEHWTVRLPGEDGLFEATAAENNGFVVVAGQSLDTVDEAVATVSRLLLVTVPLLIVLLAVATWIVVGRALRPVERMRREVDAVGGTTLHRRVDDHGARDEIGRLATTMNSMLDRLEASQRSQRRFVSDASHELKSPLASLRQYAEVAQAHPDRISSQELTDAILDEGARLERLVQGMLVLARADETTLGPTGRAVDLDDIVLAEARRIRDLTSIAVGTADVAPARVGGDEGTLGQVVRNLVDNAARHARSRIELTLTDGVLLAVDDDGDGIPPEERERIFERFVRLDDARSRDAGGSGLGLAIVREIVAAHGGSVAVSTGRLGGARFEVRLPAPAQSAG